MKSNIDNPELKSVCERQEITELTDAKARFIDSIAKLSENGNEKIANTKECAPLKNSFLQAPKFQPIAEKATTIITAVDAILDPFNNLVDARIIAPDITPIDSGYFTEANAYMESTINDLLTEKGYVIQNSTGTAEVVSSIIDTVGSDEDEALKSPEQIKEEIDVQIEITTLDSNTVKTELCPPVPTKSIVAFSATATENYEYGIGGAKQFFIPHAYELKQNGKLIKEIELYEDENGLADLSMSEETDQIELDIEYAKEYVDEIDYLDKNTMDTEGLNMYMDSEGNIMKTQEQDYLNPLSNQEDSNGKYYPDSWKKTQINDGELLFQLSSDGKTFSSYFTNSKTINSCIHSGKLNFQELREKLQVVDGADKICLTAYRCKWGD